MIIDQTLDSKGPSEETTETTKLTLSARDILRLPAALDLSAFIQEQPITFLVEIETTESEAVTLTANIHTNGTVTYTSLDSSYEFTINNIGGAAANFPDNLDTFIPDTDLTAIHWTIDPNTQHVQENHQTLSDSRIAQMINDYSNLVQKTATEMPNEDLQTILTITDTKLLRGEIPAAHDTLPVTKRIKKVVEERTGKDLGTYAIMISKHNSEFQTQTPGRVVLLGTNADVVLDPYYDIETNQWRAGLYSPTEPIIKLTTAVKNPGTYIDRKADEYSSQTRIIGDQPLIILTKNGGGLGVNARNDAELAREGYHNLTTPLGEDAFHQVQNILIEFAQRNARAQLEAAVSEAFGLDEKTKLNLTAALPNITDNQIQLVQNQSNFIGIKSKPITTKSGAPTGEYNTTIIMNVGGVPVEINYTQGQLSLLPNFDALPRQTQHNLALLLSNSQWDSKQIQPYLGVIFLPKRSAGQWINSPAIEPRNTIPYFVNFPLNAGAEKIFPGNALTNAPRTDAYLIKTQDGHNLLISPTSNTEVNVYQLGARDGAIIASIGLGQLPNPTDFGAVTAEEINQLQLLLASTRKIVNGTIVGADDELFPEYCEAFNLTMEKGWTRFAINRFVTMLANDPDIQQELIAAFQSKMPIFDGTESFTIPKDGAGVSKTRQRTSPSEVGSPMYNYKVGIQGDGITIPEQLYVTISGNTLSLSTDTYSHQPPLNYIISYFNILKILTNKSLAIKATEINPTMIIEQESIINGLEFKVNDVVVSDLNKENEVIGERIIRKTADNNQEKYYEILPGNEERELSQYIEEDVALELMYEEITKKPSQIFSSYIRTLDLVNEKARKIAMARSLNRSAELLGIEYTVANTDEFGKRLMTRYEEIIDALEKQISDPGVANGYITEFNKYDDILEIHLQFKDIFNDRNHQRIIKIDLKEGEFELVERRIETSSGTTRIVEYIEEHPLATKLVEKLITSKTLNISSQEIGEVYVNYHNRTNNMWVHSADGKQIAVRLGTNGTDQIKIFDVSSNANPNFIYNSTTPEDYELSMNAAYIIDDSGTINTSLDPASIVERLFFRRNKILPQPKKSELSIFYTIANQTAGIEAMIKLYEKESDTVEKVRQAIDRSDLANAGILPNPSVGNLYADNAAGDTMHSLAALSALLGDTELVGSITNDTILDHPGDLKRGTFKIPMDAKVLFGIDNSQIPDPRSFFQRLLDRGEKPAADIGTSLDSGLMLVTDVTKPGSNGYPCIAIGPYPRQIGTNRVDQRELAPVVWVTGIRYDQQQQKPILVIAPTPHKYNEQTKTYQPADLPLSFNNPFIERIRENPFNKGYEYYLRLIIENDDIGELVQQINQARDYESMIILAELLGLDMTDFVSRNQQPDIIDELHAQMMQPFWEAAHHGFLVEDIGEVVID